jgi:hypothetical protein
VGFERGKTAIEPGLDSRERSARHPRNFLQRHFFVEAENEHFAMKRVEREESFSDELAAFESGEMLERSFLLADHFERAFFVAGLAHFLEAGHGTAAAEIDDEVAGDGEEPGIEARIAVELSAAEEDTHPGFLEEVFGELAIAGEIEQIAQEAVLVLQNQLVKELGVMALEAFGDAGVFGPDLIGELERCCTHVNFRDVGWTVEDAAGDEFFEFLRYVQRECSAL